MSYVYFLVDSDDQATIDSVKIGCSEGPESRKQVLQTGNPQKIYLYSCFKGDFETEKMLHEYFSQYRLTGEWFNMRDGGMKELLDKLLYYSAKFERTSETDREFILRFKLHLERELQIMKSNCGH